MDRRTLLALVLMAAVIVITPMLFPSSRRPAPATIADSAVVAPTATPAAPNAKQEAPAAVPSVAAPSSPGSPLPPSASRGARAESTVVAAPRVQMVLLNPGANPAAVRVAGYKNL